MNHIKNKQTLASRSLCAPRGGLATLCALLLLLGLFSCSGATEEEPLLPEEVETEGEGNIYLTLNVGVIDGFDGELLARSRQTRADDFYFEEKTRPNEILRTLNVFITDTEDKIEGVRAVEYTQYGTLVDSNLTFRLRPGKKRIYLIGNAPSLPQEVRDNYENLKIGDTYPSATMADVILTRRNSLPFYTDAELIPMAESFDLNMEDIIPGPEPVYVYRDYFITRIAVKYTFIVFEDLPALRVRLSNMADRQYFIPRELYYNPGKYLPAVVIDGIPGRSITSFSSPLLPSQTQDYELELTGKELVQVTGADGVKVDAYRYDPVYLMESPSTSFTVNAGVAAGDEGEALTELEWLGALELPNLPLLPRNTHVVVRMSFRSEYKCQVDLVPYRGCFLDPFFGLDPSLNP